MKITEITLPKKPIAEDASAGGTSSGAVATSMGGGDGFGLSPCMKATPKRKTKTNMRKR